jgi:hypothetical protein
MAKAVWPVLLLVAMTGCGTTRMTDTQRAASEMLLISQAIDSTIAQMDCSSLSKQSVFLDTQYLDGTVDKGYVISTLRQHLLASGVRLLEDRKTADYVVEARSGAVGTDRHGLLVGIPQTSIPAISLVQATQIPEIALVKRTEMKGVAKLAVFAYERKSGTMVWQSGLMESRSNLRDTWVFGAGPFSRGTIKRTTELAGDELPRMPFNNETAKKLPNPDIKPASATELPEPGHIPMPTQER